MPARVQGPETIGPDRYEVELGVTVAAVAGSFKGIVNRTGFIGGLILREDGSDGPTQQVIPRGA